MQVLNTAVIGAGMISNAHCEAYMRSRFSKLVAVADPIKERRETISKKYGLKEFEAYKDLLRDDTIDLVSVCTPDFTHADITIDSLNAGKHVVVEKPMATTLEDCDRMIDAMKSNNRELIVDFEYRFNPFFQSMKQSAVRGDVGDLKAMSIYYWRHPFRVKPQKWIHQSKYTSMMLQEGCHYVDLFRWICGDVSSVFARSTRIRDDIDFDQLLYGELKHENGVQSQYSHTIVGNQIRHNVWLMGTKAAINGLMVYSTTEGYFAELVQKTHKLNISEDIVEDYSVKVFGEREVWDNFVIPRLIEDFLDRTIKRQSQELTAYDGRKSVELALALEESARSLKEITLPLSQTPQFVLSRAQKGV